LLTLAQLAARWAASEVLYNEDAEREEVAGNVISLRILIEEMLPVLSHVASLMTPASHTSVAAEGSRSSSAGTVGSLACSRGVATTTGNQDFYWEPQQARLPRPAASGSNDTCNPCHSHALYLADSTLQLLMAAAYLTETSVRLASKRPIHYTVLARGLRYMGSDTWHLADDSSDGIVAALDAVLSLAHALVMKGAWWQEAKAHYPLLLIEALLTVAQVDQHFVRASPSQPQHCVGVQSLNTGLPSTHPWVCCMHAPACRAWLMCVTRQQG
jgi:hypothetical protein